MNIKFRFTRPRPIDFTLTVRVGTDGWFKGTLPKEASGLLQECGVELQHNQLKNIGYVSNDTLRGLKEKIGEMFRIAASEEIIDEREVIRYQITTRGTYAVDRNNKEIHPCGFRGNKDIYWVQHCTDNLNACNNGVYGITWYTEICNRLIKKNGLGIERMEYTRVSDRFPDSRKNDRNYLLCIVGGKPERGNLVDIDATPEACTFFANLYKSFFGLCENIHEFLTPDGIKRAIENNQKLLG